jgi:4-hydroxybenzoate polyprenyltransferase
LAKLRGLLSYLPAPWRPYILHMRPRAFPIVAAHFSVGAMLASGLHLTPDVIWRWAVGVLLWAGFGHSGTLALNSAIDQDRGDIGYLSDPPPVPRYLWLYALLLLVLGGVGALLLAPRFSIVYAVCAVMAVLYSVPPVRLKSIAGADVLNNSIGYGALTLYGGWAALDRVMTPELWLVMAAFFCLFAAFYPLTQIYQYEEDQARGDRTLVIALGKRGALRWATALVIAAFLFLGAAAWERHLTPWFWLVLAAFVFWMAVLLPWLSCPYAYPEQKGMYRALWAWALTDISVVLALAL